MNYNQSDWCGANRGYGVALAVVHAISLIGFNKQSRTLFVVYFQLKSEALNAHSMSKTS